MPPVTNAPGSSKGKTRLRLCSRNNAGQVNPAMIFPLPTPAPPRAGRRDGPLTSGGGHTPRFGHPPPSLRAGHRPPHIGRAALSAHHLHRVARLPLGWMVAHQHQQETALPQQARGPRSRRVRRTRNRQPPACQNRLKRPSPHRSRQKSLPRSPRASPLPSVGVALCDNGRKRRAKMCPGDVIPRPVNGPSRHHPRRSPDPLTWTITLVRVVLADVWSAKPGVVIRLAVTALIRPPGHHLRPALRAVVHITPR